VLLLLLEWELTNRMCAGWFITTCQKNIEGYYQEIGRCRPRWLAIRNHIIWKLRRCNQFALSAVLLAKLEEWSSTDALSCRRKYCCLFWRTRLRRNCDIYPPTFFNGVIA
jgi:hypothetical protein